MIKTNMLPYLLLATVSIVSSTAFSTEYIYLDLMANTPPTPKCASKAESSKSVEKKFDRYTKKKFCQTQGYGWHLDQVLEKGNLVCNECSNRPDNYKCSYQDVVVKCRRIKPGSVGLLPGQS